jgi:hypothetical protein
MTRRQKYPLRALINKERQELERISRAIERKTISKGQD